MQIQLIWNGSEESFEHRLQVYFMYSRVHGLTDIDFHSVTARDWIAMRSPGEDALARLQLSKDTTAEEIQTVVQQIAQKGGYKTIVISIAQ